MKNVLVYGLGVSGISSVKALSKLGYKVYTYDKNKENIEQLKGYDYSPISHSKIMEIDYDFVVKSPGIKPSDDLLINLKSKYEVITDIEVSYRLFKNRDFLAITGTNGKTTTTSMITHILNKCGNPAESVGNIGEGILRKMLDDEKSVFVEELSSFQLKDSPSYHPHIAGILNITEDHIDWHGDYEDYINSKLNICKNQNRNDYLVINHDDGILQDNKSSFNAQIYEFSIKSKVNRGLYLDGDFIKFTDSINEKQILNVNDLMVIGKHNYQNIMAAILMTYLFGLSFDQIAKAAKTFKSIAHRLEFVDEVKGVKIYNDSKATNVDAAIKAIDSFNSPIIIIAGGYDKKIDYSDYIKSFKKNGKHMVIIGETSDQLKDMCEEYDIDYVLAKDMDEAVKISTETAKSGDIILLAPASASWDMYKSYEARGDDFKEKIEKYKGNIK